MTSIAQLTSQVELLTSQSRYLRDENFILKTKNSVFQDIIKYQLKTMTWFQILLKFLVDHKIPFITALCSGDIISIPNKIVSFIETSINAYEKHLEIERASLNFPAYRPFVYTRNVSSMFEFNQKLIQLNLYSSQKLLADRSKIYSIHFINDLRGLFKRHNMILEADEFLKSIEASKIIFWLLRDVFARIPFLMQDFDSDKIADSVESIKEWIFTTFREYTVNILEKQAFALEPRIYIEPIVVSFLNTLGDTFFFKDTIIELMNKKSYTLEKNSSLMDRDVFNKFSVLMFKKKIAQNKIYDVPKVDFIFEKNDIPSILVFLNAIFSITDYRTEGEQLANNYLLQNLYLQKFLKCSVEQLGIDVGNKNFVNPIKIFTDSLRFTN